VTDKAGAQTTYGYNARDELTSATNAAGHNYTYKYAVKAHGEQRWHYGDLFWVVGSHRSTFSDSKWIFSLSCVISR
jgi:hypothetical protein